MLERIEGSCPVFVPASSARKPAEVKPAFEEVCLSPLRNTVLLDYMAGRGIPADIAARECVEVHYRMRGRWYFGVGFRNRRGAVEIRNAYFKGSTSPKDITHIRHTGGDSGLSTVLVFEGFMDYLSYLALKRGRPVPDCVVLNSVSNLSKAAEILKGYGHVCCFLDNDATGKCATEEIGRICAKVSDKSVHYLPHKDLNEFLQERIRAGQSRTDVPMKPTDGWKRRI